MLKILQISCRYNVSAVTAMRYFDMFNQKITKLPEVIPLKSWICRSSKIVPKLTVTGFGKSSTQWMYLGQMDILKDATTKPKC